MSEQQKVEVWPSESVSGIWVGEHSPSGVMSQGESDIEAFKATVDALQLQRKWQRKEPHMDTLIDLVFKLLDAIMAQTDNLPPEEAAQARQRLQGGITERAARIAADEAGDLAAIPIKPTHNPGGGTPTDGMG